jgi:cell division protein FtsI/penicillin-binding protein 2
VKTDFSTRLLFIRILFILAGAAILLQIVHLQTSASASDLRKLGELYSYKRELVYPERGYIYDRYGRLLAGNEQVYEVGVNLSEMRGQNNAQSIASVVSTVLDMDYNEVYGNLTNPKNPKAVYVVLKNYVSLEKGNRLKSIQNEYEKYIAEMGSAKSQSAPPNLRGLELTPHLQRSYPENNLASNILGFYTRNNEAVMGIESKYNDLLEGSPVEVVVSIDPNQIEEIPTIPSGASLILTIDREIQAEMENIIDRAVKSSGAISGTLLVYDPETGEFLAMASNPRMNPNEYWDYLDMKHFNRSVDYPFEPGSVFKVLTMAAALDSGTVQPDTPFVDTGVIEVGGLKIYNWDRSAWGPQTMLGCMQHSLNVCLSWVALQMGADKFYSYLKAFGIGHRTNIDLAGESLWPLAVPGDENWYESSLATNSFGQGLSTTPVQLVTAVGAIANDGVMMAPHILLGFVEDGKQYNTNPQVVGTPIKKETAQILTGMLTLSLEEEASDALVEGYRVAGKTGTAEIAIPGKGYVTNMTNASFIGWGPSEDPQFVVYIWLEEPKTAPWGSVVAAPVFSQVVEKLVVLMDIPPDDVRLGLRSQ